MTKKIHIPYSHHFNGALIVFTIFFLAITVYAGDFTGLKDDDFLQKSAISKDRLLIWDKNYETKGYLDTSIIDPRKTVLYDTDGKPVGYFEKDVIDNRKIRFHQTGKSKQDGKLTIDYDKGYLQRSVIDSRKTVLYDSDGDPKGYFEKNVVDSRKLRFHQKK